MFVETHRIIKSGWYKFVRDRSATSAALVTMIIVLFLATSFVLMHGFGNFLTAQLQQRINIGTYFKQTATEDQILQAKDQLSAMPEVKSVTYVSKNQALKKFVNENKNDQVIMRSLDAVGENPLEASLDITAWDPNAYNQISQFIQNSSFAQLVDKVDYQDRAPAIQKLTNILDGVKTGMIAVGILGGLIAILVVFNTIRLAIYNSKEEIEVMRLVGASNWFIRGPFVVQGIFVGAVAMIATLVIVVSLLLLFSPSVDSFSGGYNPWSYFKDHLALIILLQLGIGAGLGIFSSLIAIRKYLRI